MQFGDPISLSALEAEARRPVYRTLSRGAALLVIALDHRMNGNTVIAEVPPVGPSRDAAPWLARWLDEGAQGLADAAIACDWAETFAKIEPGEAPRLCLLSREAFVARLDWLLQSSFSFYDHALIEPLVVRDAFLADELPASPALYRYYEVDVPTLAPRIGYFDHLGNDACLAWTDGARLGVLFTNGSD